MQLPLFNVPAFEKLFEDTLIHGNVFKNPIVADIVEASFYVSFQHPLRGGGYGETIKAVLDGILHTSLRTKPIGVRVCCRFGDWFQRQTVQCLHGSVRHCRDAERPKFSVFLWNIHPSERLCFVASSFQLPYGFGLSAGSIP